MIYNIDKHFPDIPRHFTLGNNDLPYHNQTPGDRSTTIYDDFRSINTKNNELQFSKQSKIDFQ